jgi:hypothetical protein
VYGSEGFNTIGDTISYPSYAQLSVTGNQTYVWDNPSTDVRALQKASGTMRVAATWFSYSSMTIDLSLTDGNAHTVALYFLDWDNLGRAERVDVVNATTNALLDSRTMSSFRDGKYLVWSIRGHVKIIITLTGGGNAAVSGLFFGPGGSASLTPNHPDNTLLNAVKSDTFPPPETKFEPPAWVLSRLLTWLAFTPVLYRT